MSITVEQLGRSLGLECHGDLAMSLETVAGFGLAGASQLTFLVPEGSIPETGYATSAAVITTPGLSQSLTAGAVILSDAPQLSFARAASLVIEKPAQQAGVDTHAVISEFAQVDPGAAIAAGAVVEADAVIGAGVQLGANSVVGQGAVIGENTRVDANVAIYPETRIGVDCRIGSNSSVGSAGFGIVPDGERWIRFPQLGRVVIGDHVDIGANCCIDRGALEDTIIESGVKMDNLIQIAHNVRIGKNTVIAACTGIAGSTRIGRNCRIGGRASIQGHITIADNTVITAVSFVNRSISQSGVYSSSVAAQENRQWLKNHARLHRLDGITRQLREVQKKMTTLTGTGEGRDKHD